MHSFNGVAPWHSDTHVSVGLSPKKVVRSQMFQSALQGLHGGLERVTRAVRLVMLDTASSSRRKCRPWLGE
jgi:hypothetical protein